MEFNPNNPDMRYKFVLPDKTSGNLVSSNLKNSPSFTGIREEVGEISADVLRKAGSKYKQELYDTMHKSFGTKVKEGFLSFCHGSKGKVVNFFKETFIEGTDLVYENREKTLKELRKNFGDTFTDCFDDIQRYNDTLSSPKNGPVRDFFKSLFKIQNGKKDRFVVIKNENDDLITIHKDPFIRNVCEGIKEFTVGTVLDLCISARNLFRKGNAKYGVSDVIASSSKKGNFFNTILDNRIAEKKARDSFYKVAGIFEKINGELKDTASKHVISNPEMASAETGKQIAQTIKKLARDSIGSASKKVGKYNTKSERAWNRLGTGAVSATFAATDFYNISMLQNNDPKKANESGRKRFAQDMRRQALTAGITYVILGAFQNKVNKSVAYAALSLGGVTLISEILSRVMGGISLKPLTPEEAKKIAEKRENKKSETKQDNPSNKPAENKPQNSPQAEFSHPVDSVFNIFTDKIGNDIQKTSPAFTSGTKTENAQNKEPEKKKTSVKSKILKGVLGIIGASLAIGFLRSKNILNIDTAIKSLSAKYNDTIEKLTRRRLILPKDDVDGFLNYLSKNNFNQQHDELVESLKFARKHGVLNGQAPAVQKFLPKKEINPTGFYYDFGYVESKGKKTAAGLLLYPINTVSKLCQKANNMVKMLFGIKPDAPKDIDAHKKTAVSFIEKYATKYRDAINKDDIYPFRKELEDAFTRHFSEANSQNKNTSIAMISRFLITIISGYFFVNDYRNEVLIESKGEDIERANSTMRERIGHKIANFFLNSMFMDLFNTTFENIYLSSVAGATGVAMATEFTNESAVRASICTPTKKMTREELIEYEDKRLNDKGIKGDYYRTFMKLTGKKPLSAKANK